MSVRRLETVKFDYANNFIHALEENDLKLATVFLNDYKHEGSILPSVLEAAVELNNEDKLDTVILESLIRSNKFDVSASHFQMAKNDGAKKAFQTYLAA